MRLLKWLDQFLNPEVDPWLIEVRSHLADFKRKHPHLFIKAAPSAADNPVASTMKPERLSNV